MNLSGLLSKLNVTDFCQKHGIRSFAVFGSYSRDEQPDNSDLAIWQYIVTDIPILKSEVEQLLEQLRNNSSMKLEEHIPNNTDHVFDRKQVEKKLKLASDLFQFAFDVKRFQIKSRQPELSDREINHLAYVLIEKGCRACKA